jgi:hypothetical protein
VWEPTTACFRWGATGVSAIAIASQSGCALETTGIVGEGWRLLGAYILRGLEVQMRSKTHRRPYILVADRLLTLRWADAALHYLRGKSVDENEAQCEDKHEFVDESEVLTSNS